MVDVKVLDLLCYLVDPHHWVSIDSLNDLSLADRVAAKVYSPVVVQIIKSLSELDSLLAVAVDRCHRFLRQKS